MTTRGAFANCMRTMRLLLVSPRGICLCLPTEDNCSVRPAAPSPSSAAGALRPPGRQHDGTWWARFGIITLVDLIDSRSAAALGAGSRGDCGGAINHDHGRVDRALAGHATSTAMSGLRARALCHQYLLHPLSLQHLVCGRGQTRCSGGISTARAARGRAPMMAPVCCRPWRTSRLPSRGCPPSRAPQTDAARPHPVRVPDAAGGRVGLAAVGVDAGPLRPAAHASRAVYLGGRESRWNLAVGSWGAL